MCQLIIRFKDHHCNIHPPIPVFSPKRINGTGEWEGKIIECNRLETTVEKKVNAAMVETFHCIGKHSVCLYRLVHSVPQLWKLK